MITESIYLKGNLEVLLLDEKNQIKDKRNITNLVVAVGKDHIVSRLSANGSAIMSHMSIGSANIAPTTSDTLLLGETARVALDSASVTNNTIAYVATFPAGTGTGTIAEAGVFNNPSANSGTLLCRTRFNEVNKAAADTIVITWNVTVE